MTLELMISVANLITLIVGIITALKKLADTHKLINSRMDEQLAMTKKVSKAEGVKQEQDRSSLRKARVRKKPTT